MKELINLLKIVSAGVISSLISALIIEKFRK